MSDQKRSGCTVLDTAVAGRCQTCGAQDLRVLRIHFIGKNGTCIPCRVLCKKCAKKLAKQLIAVCSFNWDPNV